MPEPFLLFDDARGDANGAGYDRARLYTRPHALIVARRGEDVAPALAEAERLRRGGAHLAGQIAYEAGLALEPRLAPLLAEAGPDDPPLVWLAAFDGWRDLAPSDVPALLAGLRGTTGPPLLGPLAPSVPRADYDSAFSVLQEAIAAGDIYQTNLTFALKGRWQGDPVALYALLRERARAGQGALCWDGAGWTLSLSPELFFALAGEAVTLRPMKGTAPRAAAPGDDRARARALAASIKDRAENLMITDLMRNDVARVARPGSVRVTDPFAIETYPTLHQMTSTVRARLAAGETALSLLAALHPCGSVTGAPKIRAMELIDAVEPAPRGLYCGAIGRVDANGDASFNVAIRTLRLIPDAPAADAGDDSAPASGRCAGGGRAVMGVGSAIVADSHAETEWQECLLKGEFARVARPDFQLIETMRFDPVLGIPLIRFHLQRLNASAAELGFVCDPHKVRNVVQSVCLQERRAARLRLTLSPDGTCAVAVAAPPDPPAEPVPCTLVPLKIPAADWRLRHKTSARGLYDEALAAARAQGAAEAVLLRSDGHVTEGSFTNVFIRRDGQLLTPPLTQGLLPGVLRASLIASGEAREEVLTACDLAEGFWVGNALRGLLPARLLR